MQGQRFRTLVGASALVLILWSAGAMAADRFTVIDLGTLGGTHSYGLAINNRGQVTGYSSLPGDAETHAFLYSNGVMTDIHPAGWRWSIATGLNEQGQIVEYGENPQGDVRAFRLDPIRD